MIEAADDEALMARVAKGDQLAFRQLSERHVRGAHGLARRILQNHADAEEVVQEAFLRLWTNAPRWQPSAALRTWFYRIVVNLCLNRRRRQPFAPLEAAGDPVDPRADAAEALEASQTTKQVAAAMAELPERQRTALQLTYYEELSNADTAAIMGSSISGVEALLVRARKALRHRLGDTLERGK